jgi:valyl-tRNA synthetase
MADGKDKSGVKPFTPPRDPGKKGVAEEFIPVLVDIVLPGQKAQGASTSEPAPEVFSGLSSSDSLPLHDVEGLRNRLTEGLDRIVQAEIEQATKEVKARILGRTQELLAELILEFTAESPMNAVTLTEPLTREELMAAAGLKTTTRNPTHSKRASRLKDMQHSTGNSVYEVEEDFYYKPAPDEEPARETPAAPQPYEDRMGKTYNPAEIEQRWYETWERQGYFSPSGVGPGYCIMLPPPNVTGSLHMGHAFQDTLMDCLIRFHRMRGGNVLWQCGTDHAGIATQMVVERQLADQGLTRQDLGRTAFVEAVWRWKEQSGGTISRQLRRLGCSMDWSRERFTLDEGLSKAVTEVFIRLYEEGLIYRGKRLVNWDPVLHTAISDLEVVSTEESGKLWHLRYPLERGDGYMVVATTRPETMLGDVAVAVHPEDERYRKLIGQKLQLPLTQRTIPVIADEYVDPAFGSGCVKITPAHDFNDYEVGRRHSLPMINIFTKDACLNENAPAVYVGLDRFEARKRILRDLEAQGLVDRIDDHKLMVPRGDRSNAVIEPYLTDQWYVKTGPLAKPAVEAVEKGLIRFVPENWTKTYYEWMHNIEDWCISRQLWWGHRIPAWYDPHGNVYVGRSEQEVRAEYEIRQNIKLTQDPDVLDTWFSSALWPFSTLGWPEETPELKAYFPTNVLVTGFDIIFFWVARMIMMGLKFTGQIPFREVYIHGLVRDAEGQKMSKSKGNILDPIDLIDGVDLETLVKKRTTGLMQPQDAPKIEKATRKQFPKGIPGFGVDALRFTFASQATQGRDIRFDLGRIEGYRNFCNKLWNAARFVMMMTQGKNPVRGGESIDLGLAERWIISRLQQTKQVVIEAIDSYRFDLAAQAIYEFTWDEYCDWYLEVSKAILNNPRSGDELRQGTLQVLVGVFETLLRLAHPFMPFITEEIWQRIAELADIEAETIMQQPYPVPDASMMDKSSLVEFEWIKTFILGVRRIRAEMNIAPGKDLPVLVKHGTAEENKWLRSNILYVVSLARIESIRVLKADPSPDMATALAGEMTLFIPLAGIIDREAELKRLGSDLAKLRQDCERSQGKLANRDYVERAPDEVVAKEKQRCEELKTTIARLEEQQRRFTDWV